MRHIATCIVVLSVLSGAPSRAETITDGNSVVEIDFSNTQKGVYSWTINGVNVLQQQWYWFRIGEGIEQSVDRLTLVEHGSAGDSAWASYASDALGLMLDIDIGLTGGSTSVLQQGFMWSYTGDTAIDFTFFAYSHFLLGGSNTVSTLR